jgi:hypothetical protein
MTQWLAQLHQLFFKLHVLLYAKLIGARYRVLKYSIALGKPQNLLPLLLFTSTSGPFLFLACAGMTSKASAAVLGTKNDSLGQPSFPARSHPGRSCNLGHSETRFFLRAHLQGLYHEASRGQF